MAVGWSERQEGVVRGALAEHDVDSGECALAAAKILPVALERDRSAVARRCDPNYGRFVSPQRKWYHHVSVRVEGHHVDALTGAPGLECDDYFSTYWSDTSAFSWKDLTTQELEELHQ